MPSIQTYFLGPTPHAPNSGLPIIHYRGVLPEPLTEESVTEFLTRDRWEKRGTWGHIPIRHFHPNSHECYGIFQGFSKLLLGVGGSDTAGGLKVNVRAGDVIVLPAGTAHSCAESSKDYRYIGVYPQGCPRWRNEMGSKSIDLASLRKETENVSMPEADPVYGVGGPLMQLWRGPGKAKL
ncbi:cupin domain-containing protein [Aspergillus stella-maris]|uniref:cupin domain-containing protein n=1 Tax=Aspergillus stella-maris TaxID=1810926 RepID=UPI003CCD2094